MVKYFHDRGILLRRYFHPGCHRMEPYRSDESYRGLELENTELLADETVIFPTGTQLSEKEVAAFADMYSEFLASSDSN